ncbi:MAG: hypothetical protein ACI8TX_002532 [Hyphomicrobiaceae bacterium]|jgi:hypothetical protein
MSQLSHPNEALFSGEKPCPIINACEHFAGSEKLITKAMQLQDRLGDIFDITMDCEDGAKQGQEKEHAEMIQKAHVTGVPLPEEAVSRLVLTIYTRSRRRAAPRSSARP